MKNWTDFSFPVPPEIKHIVDRTYAFGYHKQQRSVLQRRVGRWEVYRCRGSQPPLEFYVDSEKEAPYCIRWAMVGWGVGRAGLG